MDADPRHREVVDLLRQKEYTTQEDKGVAPEQAVQVTGTKQRYSPGDLLKMGYTAQEINEARAYIREYDALPVTDRAMRRTADTTKGIAATVASAVPMTGEMTTQGVKDIRATQKNEAALDKELEGDARGKELKDRITAVDMDYNPQYTDEDLRGMADGFQPVGDHIVTEYYRPLLEQNNFLPAPCPEKFSPAGQCWQVAPAVGCGYNADAASASCRSDPAHGRIYPDPDTDTSAEYGAGVTHASWTARAYRNSTSASCRTSLPTPALSLIHI